MDDQSVGDIIVIGGGGFGGHSQNFLIEDYILKQARCDNPSICFLPTASAENDAYIARFFEVFSQLQCQPKVLRLFQRTPDVKSLILNSDIIYVGGGNTKSMLAVFKAWGIDQLLQQSNQQGTVLAGVSAGMICWYEQGITDSYQDKMDILPCLSMIPGCACPHYDSEGDRQPLVHQLIQDNIIQECIAVEDGAAIHYKDHKHHRSIAFQPQKNAYTVKLVGGSITEEKHIMRSLT